MKLLTAKDIFNIHENVINVGELQGLGVNKSIDSIIMRIDSRLDYDMVSDIFDLAAAYCTFIARGHLFNDANKRTAFTCMDVCLRNNGINIKFGYQEIGSIIIDVAQGKIDEIELAKILRMKLPIQ
jgi:death-on-curing protein